MGYLKGQGSIAKMTTLQRCCSLRVIRAIDQASSSTTEMKHNMACRDMFCSFSPDECLVASLLDVRFAPFDLPMAWALCRTAFDGDMLRWWLGFLGLMHQGTGVHLPTRMQLFRTLVCIPACLSPARLRYRALHFTSACTPLDSCSHLLSPNFVFPRRLGHQD